jgi:outer membrane lipoprotein-sorting protein
MGRLQVVSTLAEIFELIHGAESSFRTVHASIRVWRDEEKNQLAFERYFEEKQERGRAVSMMFAVGDPDEAETPTETEERIRLWLVRPSRWREEVEGRWPRLSVFDGEKLFTYTPDLGALEQAEPGGAEGEASFLLAPAQLLPGLELEPQGETELAGRRAIRVGGRPRRTPRDDIRPGLALGADAYELTIDAESGILLRVAAYRDGEAFATTEITEIVFDQALDPELFRFQPPEGEVIRRPEDVFLGERSTTIEEAAARSSFSVWIPSRLPAGQVVDRRADWELDVLHQQASERPRTEEMVMLHYWHEGRGSIDVRESRGEGGLEAKPPWERVEIDGEHALVRRPPPRKMHVPAYVRLEREGTRIEISSAELDIEELIGVARSLVPAATTPPSFDVADG